MSRGSRSQLIVDAVAARPGMNGVNDSAPTLIDEAPMDATHRRL